MIKKGYVYPQTILKVYKIMKRKPLMVFGISDFGGGGSLKHNRNALDILIKLGVVEIVPFIYVTNKKTNSRRTVKGYKLITQSEN